MWSYPNTTGTLAGLQLALLILSSVVTLQKWVWDTITQNG